MQAIVFYIIKLFFSINQNKYLAEVIQKVTNQLTNLFSCFIITINKIIFRGDESNDESNDAESNDDGAGPYIQIEL